METTSIEFRVPEESLYSIILFDIQKPNGVRTTLTEKSTASDSTWTLVSQGPVASCRSNYDCWDQAVSALVNRVTVDELLAL